MMMMRLEDGSAVKVTTIFRVETTYEPWPTQKVSRRYSRIPAQACASIQGVRKSDRTLDRAEVREEETLAPVA